MLFLGRSPLFQLDDFDPFKQMMPEAMHMAYLGVVRLLCVLTIAVGKERNSKNRHPRLKKEAIGRSLLEIKVPSEVSIKEEILNLQSSI